MLLKAALRRFVVNQIIAANTDAGAKVYENRALPTEVAALPIIVVTTPHDTKEPQMRGSTLYNSIVTLHVAIRTAGASGAVVTAAPELAAAAAEALVEQVINATVANQAMLDFDGLQQFAAIESYLKVNGEGGIITAEADLAFRVELIERIDPTRPTPLLDIRSTVTDPTAATTLIQFDAPLAQ